MKNRLLIMTLGAITLAGCANKENFLPQPDQTMSDVYNQSMGSAGMGRLMDERSTLRRGLTEADSDYSDFVRTEKTQLDTRFAKLPNPTLYMFVAPHLATGDQVPVPGYLTEFQFYQRDHYALPGEVPQQVVGQ